MKIGFVGLGNMGSVLASNLVHAGHEVIAHDIRGPERAPEGLTHVPSIAEVARRAEVLVFSLPDGDVCQQVAGEILSADGGVKHVVDTSTIGVRAAQTIDSVLSGAGVAYVDAPVSGGVAGARARTLVVMYAGAPDACVAVAPVLAGLTDRRYRVGDRPGMAQALKLANNFLAATALLATSEAIAFGKSVGLDMGTMLEVLNASSGQNSATAEKFPNHVVTGRYEAGFSNALMAKDTRLYVRAVAELGGPSTVAGLVAATWERFATSEPGADFTRIFPFVAGSAER